MYSASPFAVPASKTLVTQDMPAVPAAKAPELKVFGYTIRVDGGGLLNLTDMWRAAGGAGAKKPALWLQNDHTEDFIHQVAKATNSRKSYLLIARPGRLGGTYAHWQIALAYAEYLSPELHMEVLALRD